MMWRPAGQFWGGHGRPEPWFALAATAALHAAVITILLIPWRPHVAPPETELVTVVQLGPPETPAPAPLVPHPQLARPQMPQVREPVVAISVPPSSDVTAPVASTAPMALRSPGRASRGDVLRSYAALLYARIVAHKRAGLHRSGTVTVRFQLDIAGRLLSETLVRSSGDPLLDAAALASVRAAAPFPVPPSDIDRAALVFTIPFIFS